MAMLKTGLCHLCPPGTKEKPLISGLCTTHYWGRITKKSRSLSIQKKQKKYSGKRSEQDTHNLKLWYEYQIDLSDWLCENCGAPIPNFSEKARHSAQAHILPKDLFPSVAKHPLNRLHLGNEYGCNCHLKWDKSWQSALSMPVISIALLRFERFKHLIDPAEVRKLPAFFKDNI